MLDLHSFTDATGFRFAPLHRLEVLNVAGANASADIMRAIFESTPHLRVLIASATHKLPLDALPASLEELDVARTRTDLDVNRIRLACPRLRRLVYHSSQTLRVALGFTAAAGRGETFRVEAVRVVLILCLLCLLWFRCFHRYVAVSSSSVQKEATKCCVL